jgi:hypothetical protein
MNQTEKVINSLEKYLSLVRFKYTTEERLTRLHILHDYYNSFNTTPSEEKLISKVEFAESLSKKLVLPLKVKGIFLSEGRPERKFYLAEELQLATENPINQRFPLMLDHEDTKAGKTIGVVTKIKYDASIRALRWWGHINDETFARNVIDKAITDVSATVFSVSDYDEEHGLLGRNLAFKELSLVMHGAEPLNKIEVGE